MFGAYRSCALEFRSSTVQTPYDTSWSFPKSLQGPRRSTLVIRNLIRERRVSVDYAVLVPF